MKNIAKSLINWLTQPISKDETDWRREVKDTPEPKPMDESFRVPLGMDGTNYREMSKKETK